MPLTTGTVVRFADVREGVEAVTRRDDYIRSQGPLERQLRLKTDRPVSEDEFAAFVGSHVRPWTDEEIARLTPLLTALGEKLAHWKLALPPVILLVKTSGDEEGGAAYCRGSSIVLPQRMVDNRRNTLARILPHEVFHVLSSHNPELRRRLYATIGFAPCNEVPLPAAIAARKITNPDAPRNTDSIVAEWQGQPAEWLPVLVAKYDRYDPARPSFFDYLDFKLLLLACDGEQRLAALRDGQPVLVEPAEVPGYAAQIGDNTKYIIHPEEILADNFVFLVDGRIDVPTPRVVQAMGEVLQAPGVAK
ncbi:MAG: hypothetical protein AB7O59_07250 [Pirellulales bacterium]